MNDALVLALDIGGTNARGEVLDRALSAPLSKASLPTPAGDGEATLATISQLCELLLAGLSAADRGRVRAVGLAVPGIIEPDGRTIRLASNLGWVNEPVADRLSAITGLPVILHHDVTAAGLAEYRLGAGAGADDLLAVFIGTGMAALVVTGGQVVVGGMHQAGEIGHLPIYPDGILCPCQQRGCLEMYCSARAIGRAYAEVTGDPDATSLDVVLALGSDERADQVWAAAMDSLAFGLLGPITLLSPSRVVFGGGLSAAGDVLVDGFRDRLTALARVAAVPEIVTAALGQRAGVLGSALGTFQALESLQPAR